MSDSDDDQAPLLVANGASSAEDSEETVFTVSQLAEQQNDGSAPIDARQMARAREERERMAQEEETVEEHADMVLTIMKPVGITMIVVITLVKSITVPNIGLSPGQVLLYQGQSSSTDSSQQITGALVTGAIVLVGVLIATTAFICLYKYRCLKIIYAWLLMASGMLLAMFGGGIFYLFISTANFAFDWISFALILWNFAVCGLVSVFWYAPPKLQQAYLVIISVLMAAVLTQLPEWPTWVVLAVIAVYDLFAVLCPKGPLRVLIDTAVERNEAIPALLYSAAVFIMMVRAPDFEDQPPPPPAPRPAAIPAPERRKGIQLGLGDFVFYSVLVGRAALFDMSTVYTCFVAVITGLFLTLLLLGIWRKALPALPISIFLGIVFFFLTSIFVLPFVEENNLAGVFV